MDIHPGPLLLVEDEPDLRDALQEYLEACGFEVVPAGSAAEALKVARENPPSAILSDLSLPDCHGDSFLEGFHSEYPECLLYVHSGDSSFVPSAVLQKMGLLRSHVFSKPADLAEMATQIQAALVNRT